MPPLAIFLLLISALMHALWNLLLKRSEEKMLAMGWIVIIGGVFSAVLLLFSGPPSRSVWIFIAVSTLLEAIYFILLSTAYNDHDFSLIYPIARGTAPAFLMLWSLLFLGEALTGGGMLGVGLIVCGMIVIGATTLLQNKDDKPHLKGIVLALSVALLISIYTIVDGTAVKQTAPLPYGLTMFVLVPFPIAMFNIRRYGWTEFISAWNASRLTLIAAAILATLAYLTVLYAYTIAPVSYSGAIREVSVVIGAVLGWQFLNEEMGGMRVIGSIIIFIGVVVIAFYG